MFLIPIEFSLETPCTEPRAARGRLKQMLVAYVSAYDTSGSNLRLCFVFEQTGLVGCPHVVETASTNHFTITFYHKTSQVQTASTSLRTQDNTICIIGSILHCKYQADRIWQEAAKP